MSYSRGFFSSTSELKRKEDTTVTLWGGPVGFAFWIELIAPGLPSAIYLSSVVCELLHRSGGFYPVRTQRVVIAGFPCHKKEEDTIVTYR
ncbi:hypothetical protein H5410_062716 [Solanum commersonii]|uniref:Uncharacterized protein n=1 Tax=Solanum commersonii TaxID=4109 RepID=A0A9J5WDJ1_SOLCO|nr:hypothetical protein H5410_062716 [Solanum commersonii]